MSNPESCDWCHKSIEVGPSTLFVERVSYGKRRLRVDEERAKVAESSIGLFPVGPDCARKLRREGIALFRLDEE